MESETEHGIKDGWLIKVGIFKTTWRRRYFVLQGGPLLGRIDYYKKEHKVWKGAITLSKVEEALGVDTIEDLNRLTDQFSKNTSDAVLAIPAIKELPRDHHFFVIKTTSRLWILGAKTAEERTQWIAAINEVAKRVNGPERSDGVCPTPPKGAQTWSMGSVNVARRSQVLRTAPSAGIGRKGVSSAIIAAAGDSTAVPDYMRTDPEGDKARLSTLSAVFKEFVDQEKALKRESACNVVPLGRLSSMDAPRPDALEKALEASRVYSAWGEQLYAYAQRLVAARCDTPSGPAGVPVVTFADRVPRAPSPAPTPSPSPAGEEPSAEGAGDVEECMRDVRYVLIVFSEALEKAVSACDRKKLAVGKYGDLPISLERAAELAANILASSVAFLRTIASPGCEEALASGMHKRLGAESPLRVLSPELVKLIAQWAHPGLVPRGGDKKEAVVVAERSSLAQLGAERAFLSKHIKRILGGDPVRFGFLNVRFPVEDANNFAKITGKVPDTAYDGELPEGRLYCELSDEALCFTTSARGDEVVIPLLWIRKLEVESSGGCFMKFTRYLDEPCAEASMETRIIYGDNTAETFAWLGDITRMFILRRQGK